MTAADYAATVADVRRLARAEICGAAASGPVGRVDRGLVSALGRAGLLARLFPLRFGGTADPLPSASTLCAVREGLATESAAAETAFAVQGLGSYPILLGGTDDLRRRWLPGVAAGDVVAAFALTEPEAGSDAAALCLRAEPDGDDFRLTGSKKWISNAPDADLYTVFARTTADAGAHGVTAFAVPGDAPGLSGRSLAVLGEHAIGTLEFDGVRVPRSAVLGALDHGFRTAMQTLDRFRPSVGAGAVGMAQSALECAVRYAGSREAFGGPIGRFQGVSHPLATMATELQAARLLVIDAAAAHDEERPTAVEAAAMAKLFATEVAGRVVDGAVQVLGAAGLERSHPLAQLYTEIRALRIYEGTSEIQRTIIARRLLEPPPIAPPN